MSGAALALLPVAYFWLHGRLLTVSGRVTLLVNHLRYGNREGGFESNTEELVRALKAATEEAFGDKAVVESDRMPIESGSKPSARQRTLPRFEVSQVGHWVFLLGIAGGGALAFGQASPGWSLGAGAASAFGEGALPGVLVAGGVLVGFGTRMSGGCTIGHGLCGVPRAQRGSLVTTLGFFGAGVAVALLLASLAG